jgi:hypothetical protein
LSAQEVTARCHNLEEFVQEVYNEKQDDPKPSYNKYRFMLEKIILNMNKAPDGKFDWIYNQELNNLQ